MARLYIVDDDPSIVSILEEIIEDHFPGAYCGSSYDGLSAISDIVRERPDVVLVDYLLPDKDGLEIIRTVKETYTPSFIMLSQITDKKMVAKAYSEGVEFFITKPINVIEVLTIINRVIEYKKANTTIAQLENIFNQGSGKPQMNKRPLGEDAALERLRKLYSKLGIVGNSGCKELMEGVLWSIHQKNDYLLVDMYEALAAGSDTLNGATIKKRIGRVIQKAFYAMVDIGIEDSLNPVYDAYAGQLFNYTEIRKEMSYKKGLTKHRGKVNIRQFIESSAVIIGDVDL